jgi:hypothetical protein
MDHDGAVNQWIGNGFSIATIATTFIGWTPAIAAVVALVWYLIQIYESATVQHWLGTRRLRKIVRLRARAAVLETEIRIPPLLPTPEN